MEFKLINRTSFRLTDLHNFDIDSDLKERIRKTLCSPLYAKRFDLIVERALIYDLEGESLSDVGVRIRRLALS